MSANEGSKIARPFGAYELLEKVGVGGMGSVYKARLAGSTDLVALKIATRSVADDAILCQRFHKEWKIASVLQHPHLVRALGHGVEKGVPYLMMEFVPGQSLDKQLKNQGPMPMAAALAVFEQVAQALGFIHQNSLIHRDIKPANVLIDPTGHAKLADLGLIKDLDSNSFLTNSRTGLGTLEFAAPEQFDDAKNVDLRCDIYALAASLYLALTGIFPFGRGSQMRVLKHKLDHQFTPLAQALEGVSPALDQIVIRSLHPDPAIRPASITEFLKGMLNQEPSRTNLQPMALPTGPAKPRERIWAPAPADSNLPKGAEATPDRRGKTRHAVKIATTLGIVSAAKHESWPAQVMDISPGGMCMRCGRRFEPGTLINVFLPETSSGRQAARLVRICWAKTQPDKTWLLGCLFASPLENEDLDRFLVGDLAKTVMLRKVTIEKGPAEPPKEPRTE